jgi:hypothetical protein
MKGAVCMPKVVPLKPLRYRGNRENPYEGKIYNKALFEGDNHEDIQVSVEKPLEIPDGVMVEVVFNLVTGKYPKLHIETIKVVK